MSTPLPEPAITDISGDFADLNPEDRIYRSASGYVVKVKTYQLAVEDPQVLAYRMTASLVDADSGKALAHPMIQGRKHISEPHLVQIHAEGPSAEPASAVEEGRRTLVRRVELGEINRAVAASAGVAPLPVLQLLH